VRADNTERQPDIIAIHDHIRPETEGLCLPVSRPRCA